MGDKNRIVLSYHNSLLKQSDVDLLNGPHWLNDQIISFYLEYLEQQIFPANTAELLFVSPEVVQCLKFVGRQEMSIFLEPLNGIAKQFIFLPLNDNDEVKTGGSHWSLLVFSRPEATFFYYDSINNSTLQRSLRPFLIELAAAINCPEFDIQRGDCIRQCNSYDCGVHVLVNIELLANRALNYDRIDDISGTIATNQQNDDPMHVTHQEIRDKRKDLLRIIKDLGGKI